jgi:hypothetical protein
VDLDTFFNLLGVLLLLPFILASFQIFRERKSRKSDNKEMLTHQIVWLSFLDSLKIREQLVAGSSDKTALVDEKLLSYSKTQILNSTISIGCENGHNTELQEALRHGLLSLSLFQSGIGDAPMPNPLSEHLLNPQMKNLELSSLERARRCAAVGDSREFAQWKMAMERANVEAEVYLKLFNERISPNSG